MKKYILSLCMLAISIVCLIMAIISFKMPNAYASLTIIIDVAVIIVNIIIILLKE